MKKELIEHIDISNKLSQLARKRLNSNVEFIELDILWKQYNETILKCLNCGISKEEIMMSVKFETTDDEKINVINNLKLLLKNGMMSKDSN